VVIQAIEFPSFLKKIGLKKLLAAIWPKSAKELRNSYMVSFGANAGAAFDSKKHVFPTQRAGIRFSSRL